MKNSKKYQLGIIGLGHMGSAIARGAVRKEYIERYQVAVYDPSKHAQADSAVEEFAYLSSPRELVRNSHIVLLAVTPQKLDEILEAIHGEEIDVVLSIVTGASISHLQNSLGNIPVIRAMPNTPLQINEGATALCMSKNCLADDYDFVFQLFASMGVTRTISEEQMNDIVAVHGSTPAYVYYFVDCIIKDAVKRGIDAESARALLVQTVIGAGELLAKNADKPLDDFISEVATEGGTTIEAVNTLKNEKMDKIIHDANENCIKRAKELGK
jgi:pyrroline-5-carboxylate reductase